MRALVGGRESAAMRHFEQADNLADASFMAGMLALKRGKFDAAEGHLKLAASRRSALGKYFAKYGVEAAATLTITDEVSATGNADLAGVLLARREGHQHQPGRTEAIHRPCALRRGDRGVRRAHWALCRRAPVQPAPSRYGRTMKSIVMLSLR